jgi:hypothetical protein
VLGPTRADQARAALAAVTGADGRAGVWGSFTGRSDVVAVVDCGRLDPDSPVRGVIAAADQLLVLARPRADELAHAADLAAMSDVLAGPAHARLLLVGHGYLPAEVEREVGLTVDGSIPWDPRTAAAVSGHATSRPRRRARLVRAATRLAAELAGDPRRMTRDRGNDPSAGDEPVSLPAGWPAPVSPNGGASRWSRP